MIFNYHYQPAAIMKKFFLTATCKVTAYRRSGRLPAVILLFLLLCFWPDLTRAQGPATTLKGMVTDESAKPLAGASVTVRGSAIATSTNEKGEFQLSSATAITALVISYTGYAAQEINVEGKSFVSVSLQTEAASLANVVVVGYGTQKKGNLTGSVSTVSSKSLTSRPVGQVSSALQGLAAGVTVTQSSGQPGADGGVIRIRGVGTLSDPNPLVLIDGVEGSLNSLDPNLIDNISILKDAASASIYGSRAANGVILVTTKRAKSGQLQISYSSYVGWQKPTNLPKMVNAIDHMLLTNEAYVNVGRSPLYSDALLQQYRTAGLTNKDLYPDTDWQKEVLTGSGFMQSHFININGGGEKIRFLTSVGYLNQQGIIEHSSFQRFIVRNNADLRYSDKLSLRFDLQLSAEITKEPGAGTASVFHYMNRIPANQQGIFSNGSWGEGWNGVNPIAVARDGGERKNTTPSAILNASLAYQPLPWLRAELTIAPRYTHYVTDEFNKAVRTYKSDGTLAFTSPALSTLNRENNEAFYNNARATHTATKRFSDHGLKFLVGASREDYRNNNFSAFRQGFVLPNYPVLNTGSATTQTNTGIAADWALQSAFARVNYDYKERYLLEVNGRLDGSSRFAKGNKYGFFPSVSAGWRISEEEFMKPLKSSITDLKLRASWGELGNQNIGNYPFTSSVATSFYTMGNQIVNTAYLTTLANAGISWETTEMRNIGVDLTLFSKLSITAEYYYKRTRDILYELDIPLIVGLGRPAQNVGVVDNKGWELAVDYRNRIGDFNYSINANISDVKNKVVDLRGVNRSGLTVSREGFPINSIYGLQADGYFQSDAEAQQHAKQFGVTKAGDLKYVDQNKDGIINDADYVIIGSTIPRYTYGGTLNASYKGFAASAFFQGVGKADGYLYQQGIMPFYLGGTVQEQHKDHWTPTNRDAAFPRLAFSETNNEQNSSFWLKNAAYLRLKNLQLSYTFSKTTLNRARINGLRIYATASNVFTLDHFWNGYDPETPVGIGNTYPQQKVYTIGLDVNL